MECLLIGLGAYFIQHMGSFNYGKIQTTGAVLVAISIPIFSSQLEKSRDAVDAANVRSAYAEASAAYLTETDGTEADYVYNVEGKSTDENWSQTSSNTMEIAGVNVKMEKGTKTVKVRFNTDGTYTITMQTSTLGEGKKEGKQ